MSEFQWTTPSRRKGDRSLGAIPPEIYQKIFSYFHRGDEMDQVEERLNTLNFYNLALVCRYFSSLAIPHVLEEIVISGRALVSLAEDRPPYTVRFCQSVINDEEPMTTLAQCVKKCRFVLWEAQDESTIMGLKSNALFSMYCNALGKMGSVNSVDFELVQIDNQIIRAMGNLENLTSLKFINCKFTEDFQVKECQAFARSLHLETLVIFNFEDGHMFHDAFTSVLNFHTLKTLGVDDWAIVRHLSEVDAWSVVKRLVHRKDRLQIQSLILHDAPNLRTLSTLFRRTPELSNLQICRMGLVKEVDSSHFPNYMLPKLSCFAGPPILAAAVVPSRPLRKVWLIGQLVSGLPFPPFLHGLDRSFLEAMKRSATPIEEIAMPIHLYFTGFLGKYLPDVSILRLVYDHGNWIEDRIVTSNDIIPVVQKLCKRWPPNPSIRELDFTFRREADDQTVFYDLPPQQELLCSDVVDAFPNIERVNFVNRVNWRRSLPDPTWRAKVPEEQRKYFRLVLGSYRHEIVDYDGCFDAVFDP